MNSRDKSFYESQWVSKHTRLVDWYKVLHNLKIELQTASALYPERRKTNYDNYLRQCRGRLHDSIAGTVYSPKRDKFIDHFEYIAGH